MKSLKIFSLIMIVCGALALPNNNYNHNRRSRLLKPKDEISQIDKSLDQLMSKSVLSSSSEGTTQSGILVTTNKMKTTPSKISDTSTETIKTLIDTKGTDDGMTNNGIKETRQSLGKIRPYIKLSSNYSTGSEVS